jgi:hypothetical protein
MKENETGREYITHREMGNAYNILVGKPKGEKTSVNISIILKYI